MTGATAIVLENWSTLYSQQEFDMANSRAVLLALAALVFANQAFVSADHGAERLLYGHDDGKVKGPNDVNSLRRCIRALADDVIAIRRSLRDLGRTDFQQGMGQMQEGFMHVQIQGSDEDCLSAGQNPQQFDHQAPIYSNPQSVAVQPQQAPAPYPIQQQPYPQQGGIHYDAQNPMGNYPGQYMNPGTNQVQHGYPHLSGTEGNPMSIQAGFGGYDSSSMGMQLAALRRALYAKAADPGAEVPSHPRPSSGPSRSY